MKRVILLIIPLLLLPPALMAQQKTIYGADSRKDLYETANPVIRRVARSAVSIFTNANLVPQGGNYRVNGRPFGDEAFMMCPNERFLDQPAAAFCSGTLIAPNLVLTAGHCMNPPGQPNQCPTAKFAFGYTVNAPGVNPQLIPASEVYSCAAVVIATVTAGYDYAVVRLDRNVAGHAPIGIDFAPTPRDGLPVFTVGGPYGLPIKAVDDGHLSQVSELRGDATTDLDTSPGNSGGGVFSANTGRLVGVHVAGWDEDLVAVDLPPGHGLPAADRRVTTGRCRATVRLAPGEGWGKKAYLPSRIPGLARLLGAPASTPVVRNVDMSLDTGSFIADPADISNMNAVLR